MDTGCIPPTVNFFQYTSGKFWRVACAEKAMSQGREENPKSCLSKF